MASRWRHCADLTGPGIEPQTSRTDSVRFATELTAGYEIRCFVLNLVHRAFFKICARPLVALNAFNDIIEVLSERFYIFTKEKENTVAHSVWKTNNGNVFMSFDVLTAKCESLSLKYRHVFRRIFLGQGPKLSRKNFIQHDFLLVPATKLVYHRGKTTDQFCLTKAFFLRSFYRSAVIG